MRVMGDINRKKGKAARKVTRSRYVERSLPPLLPNSSWAYDTGARRGVCGRIEGVGEAKRDTRLEGISFVDRATVTVSLERGSRGFAFEHRYTYEHHKTLPRP